MPERSVDRWLAQAARSPFPGGRVILLAVLFGIVLCAIGGALAWRSYSSRSEQAEDRILTAASEAARASEQFFTDRIAVLEAIAEMPAFDMPGPSTLGPVLEVMANEDLGFHGGIGWADSSGELQVSTALQPSLLPLDLSGRDYASVVLETRLPYVGAARQSSSGGTVIPVAVPTFDNTGSLSGMLVAGIVADELSTEIPALAPASIDLRVVDRSGEMILDNGAPTILEPPVNHELLDPEGPSIVNGEGLRGDAGRIAAISRVDASGWVVVAEQSHAVALQGARSRLVGELAVLAAFTLVTLGAALFAAQRLDDSHREMIRGARDLGAMEVLSERLSTAPDTRSIAGGAIDVFGQVFESNAVVVGLANGDRGEMRVFVDRATADIVEYAVPLEVSSVLNDVMSSDHLLVLNARQVAERYPETEDVEAEGRSGVVAGRFVGPEASGAVGIYIEGGFPPPGADLELFAAMVPMLGDPFGRARVAERERHASRTFQEALLPQDALGIDIPLQRAVRYQPAVGDAEVGGDWYDLWMIDDHRVGMVVGDVVGRGVVAAAAMGQLRSAVRAAVGAAMSPTDALGYVDALTRQITGSAGATVVLGVLDLRNGAARLASAGHLPPLLAASDGVLVLSEMSGTPLGFFPSGVGRRGMTVKLEPEDTLVLYSDGLTERRDEIIDQGIERAVRVLRDYQDLPVEGLADTLLERMAIPDNPDDVALVCVRPVSDPPRHFTGVIPITKFHQLHDALVDWLRVSRHEPAAETSDRVDEMVSAVLEVVGPQAVGEVMVEVDPIDAKLAVVVEYRKRPGPTGLNLDRRILRLWGDGEITSRGPRISFFVG